MVPDNAWVYSALVISGVALIFRVQVRAAVVAGGWRRNLVLSTLAVGVWLAVAELRSPLLALLVGLLLGYCVLAYSDESARRRTSTGEHDAG